LRRVCKDEEKTQKKKTHVGPDLRGRGANWAVAQGPPQLRGLRKKQ